MGTDHEEFAAAARALDEAFIRHANAWQARSARRSLLCRECAGATT